MHKNFVSKSAIDAKKKNKTDHLKEKLKQVHISTAYRVLEGSILQVVDMFRKCHGRSFSLRSGNLKKKEKS